jgi:hypothetical protein
MRQLTNTTIRFGNTGPLEFGNHWTEQIISVKYDPGNPAFGFDPDAVRIFVTPNNEKLTPTDRTCAPAVCVRKIQSNSFVISALNTDTVGGFAGFNWVAIAEAGEKVGKEFNTDLGIGLVLPQYFTDTNGPGDWCSFGVPYSKPFASAKHGSPIALLTGHNFGEAFSCKEIDNGSNPAQRTDPTITDLAGGSFDQGLTTYRNQAYIAGAVPVVTDAFTPNKKAGLTFVARNQEGEGTSGFYYAAFALPESPSGSISGDLWVETGNTSFPKLISRVSDYFSQQYWHIYFSQPFVAPPIVLVTANDLGPDLAFSGQPPVPPSRAVAQAHDVTPYGFTLALRNGDGDYRKANAYCSVWMCIGLRIVKKSKEHYQAATRNVRK